MKGSQTNGGATPVTLVSGVVCSIASAMLWGMYPVLGRYLMLRQPGEPSAASVLAVICFWNTIIIVPYYLCTNFRIDDEGEDKIEESEEDTTTETETETEADADADALDETDALDDTGTVTEAVAPSRKARIALAYGLLCLLRMITNLQSVSMTKAYLTQMTAMTLPFFTAFLARFVLKEKIHSALYPAVLVMITGSLLVLYGQGAFSPSDGEDGGDFAVSDFYGILLQLLSVLLSSLLKIAFKSTEGTLDTVELLVAQFTVTAVPLLLWSFIYERDALYFMFYGLNTDGWLALVGMSVGIYIVGNYLQIMAVRTIGASNHSASNSLRLISAVAGSSLLLREYLRGALGYVGCLLVILAVFGYWYFVRFRKREEEDTGEAEGNISMKSYQAGEQSIANRNVTNAERVVARV